MLARVFYVLPVYNIPEGPQEMISARMGLSISSFWQSNSIIVLSEKNSTMNRLYVACHTG